MAWGRGPAPREGLWSRVCPVTLGCPPRGGPRADLRLGGSRPAAPLERGAVAVALAGFVKPLTELLRTQVEAEYVFS